MDWLEAVLLIAGLGTGIIITFTGRSVINRFRSWRKWKRWNRERRPVADKGPLDRWDLYEWDLYEDAKAEKANPDPEKVKPLTKQARNRKLWKTWSEDHEPLKKRA